MKVWCWTVHQRSPATFSPSHLPFFSHLWRHEGLCAYRTLGSQQCETPNTRVLLLKGGITCFLPGRLGVDSDDDDGDFFAVCGGRTHPNAANMASCGMTGHGDL